MRNINQKHQPKPDDPRIYCFDSPASDQAFEKSVSTLIAKLQDHSRLMFVSEQNILRMNHGCNWVHSARNSDWDSSMHTISSEFLIPFKEIVENDLGLIGRTILPVSKDMDKQFAQNMYGVIGEAAQEVGNVVDAKTEGSFGAWMLELFRKLELGVDRDGNVSMPHLHVGPDLYRRLPDEMSKIPPEINAEIERVKAAKIQDALAREAERKAKFKRVEG